MAETSSIFHEPDYLRTPGESLSESEIRSDEIQRLVADMIDLSASENFLAVTPHNLSRVELPNLLISFTDTEGHRNYEDPGVIFNPRVVDASRIQPSGEGCGSVYAVRNDTQQKIYLLCNVMRPRILHIAGLDQTGELVSRRFEGVEAMAVHHELEHLDGRMIIDHQQELLRDNSFAHFIFGHEGNFYLETTEDFTPEQVKTLSGIPFAAFHAAKDGNRDLALYYDLLAQQKLCVPVGGELVPLKPGRSFFTT